jgi:hypothetical protein
MKRDRVIEITETVLEMLPESSTDKPQMPEPIQDFETPFDASLGCWTAQHTSNQATTDDPSGSRRRPRTWPKAHARGRSLWG